MLHVGDLKIAQNNNLAVNLPRQQGSKIDHDFSSDAGFFTILKGQVQERGQISTKAFEISEPARNATIAAPEEKGPREDAARTAPGEETAQAIGRTGEQGQKTAAQLQGREDKSADTKNSMEKKPALNQQQGNTIEKETEAGARIRQKQKQKKTGESDTQDIQESLHRMIDYLKGKEQPELRSVRAAAQELHDLLRSSKQNPGRELLKKSLDKLAATIDGYVTNMQGAKTGQLAGPVAGIKELLKKMKTGDDKNQARKHADAADAIAPAVKELLAKVESLFGAVKGEGTQQRSGANDQGTGTSLTFSAMKSDVSARHADTAAAAPKNSAFSENLQSIIQNARVVVKDSRNGSFSVRLHPEELGSVKISLSLHEGIVRGNFLVETQEAKNLLTGNLDYIKQQLSEAGIAVGEFQVNVNDQRGQLLKDRDDSRVIFTTPAGQAAEIENSFAPNAQGFHDGHVNLVI